MKMPGSKAIEDQDHKLETGSGGGMVSTFLVLMEKIEICSPDSVKRNATDLQLSRVTATPISRCSNRFNCYKQRLATIFFLPLIMTQKPGA